MEEALSRVESGNLDIDGAFVIVDCLSNDARNTRAGPALSPDELVVQVARLRERLWAAGAAGVVVCSIKPTTRTNVIEHNAAVHRYLLQRREFDGGHGSCTPIRLEHLRNDGLHIQPRFFGLLQNTYACIIQGKEVPSPTPIQDYVPVHVRQSYVREWPRVGGGREEPGHSLVNHGWWW